MFRWVGTRQGSCNPRTVLGNTPPPLSTPETILALSCQLYTTAAWCRVMRIQVSSHLHLLLPLPRPVQRLQRPNAPTTARRLAPTTSKTSLNGAGMGNRLQGLSSSTTYAVRAPRNPNISVEEAILISSKKYELFGSVGPNILLSLISE